MVGGDLIQRFRQRVLFLICEAAFALSCVLAALAPEIISYSAGRVLQGLATGLLLVIALPRIIQRFPSECVPITAAAINIGFFGAVTVGPLIGGLVRHMRGGCSMVFSRFWALQISSLPYSPSLTPSQGMPFDLAAVLLALAGTMLPFWAVGVSDRPCLQRPWRSD